MTGRPTATAGAALACAALCWLAACAGAGGGGRADATGTADAADAVDAAAHDVTGDGVAPPPAAKQILFGDLHVHSTNSIDALTFNLPILGGRGFLGPSLHCDFARFCAQLDFWAITDHPEQARLDLWDGAREDVRVCNDLEGGDDEAPRMVTFLGWEWTQSAFSPATAFGHKNVLFVDTDDDAVPSRPVGAADAVVFVPRDLVPTAVTLAKGLDPDNATFYDGVGERLLAGIDAPICPSGVDTRDLPADCSELAADPAELYEKLDQWGFDALVIPHGTTWGAHNPILASWKWQLDPRQHVPRYERLVEVFSGHGNSEEYRPWRHAVEREDGSLACPEPTSDFEPCCWRAGEIVRARSAACGADPEGAACADDVATARQAYLDAGFSGVTTVRNTTAENWLDCGQCRDCFQPPFDYRPGISVQAAMAMSWFGEGDGGGDATEPLRYRWGFVGSTDSHKTGPGAGYKEAREMSDSFGSAAPEFDATVDLVAASLFPEQERQNSYYYSGALVAVHAEGRSRDAIWSALKRREVYATSGERILLHFDLTNAPDGERLPMGQEVRMAEVPRFEVRAVGSFRQAPGCPPEIVAAAPEGFIESACMGECYHPTDERNRITRVEVVKITPQVRPDEPLEGLIVDPFLVLPCDPDPAGCAVSFTDPDFPADGRPALYYVRVIQEPTPQFNAANLRCDAGPDGTCAATDPCPGDHRGAQDDCLAEDEERAWSSPIFVSP